MQYRQVWPPIFLCLLVAFAIPTGVGAQCKFEAKTYSLPAAMVGREYGADIKIDVGGCEPVSLEVVGLPAEMKFSDTAASGGGSIRLVKIFGTPSCEGWSSLALLGKSRGGVLVGVKYYSLRVGPDR